MTENTCKRCWKCKQTKPVDNFHRDSSRKDKLQRSCKSCRSLLNKALNKKHRVKSILDQLEDPKTTLDDIESELKRRGITT